MTAGSPNLVEIPGCRDLQPIGRGAASVMFRAEHSRLSRTVAVKVLTHGDDEARPQFERELETTVLLSSSHPRLVRILDIGATRRGVPYIIMSYCADGSYADVLREHGPQPVETVVAAGAAVAEALQAAHEAGLVHGAVKPSNIMRTGFGPALTDFPIARAATAPDLGGLDPTTLAHAAPEFLRDRVPSSASDVYSLASALWHLLAGYPPFADPDDVAPDPAVLRERALTDPAPAVPGDDVPPWLQRELARALSKEPERRHPSALVFASALMAGLEPDKTAPGRPEPLAMEPEPLLMKDVLPAAPAYVETEEPLWPGDGTAENRALYQRMLGEPVRPYPAATPPGRAAPEVDYDYDDAVPPPEAYGQDVDPFKDADMWSEPRRSRPTWLYIATGASVVLLCAVCAFRLFSGGEHHAAAPPPALGSDPAGTSGPSPDFGDPAGSAPADSPAGSGSSSSPALSGAAGTLKATTEGVPRDVKLTDEGASITLTWRDPTAGAVQFAVLGGPRGAAVTVQKVLRPGTTRLTLQGLNTTQDYCYQVWAVVSVDSYAPSAQVCTKRY
ncbi:protein kinase domain-containing protein [Dactylosporangium sp. CA-092794]|uniref:serine/threonine-protein kinase n=1 Tax=Dactylosporangium sp. CA-092794 TaxID=3239929 RepID=UPI003D93C2D2